MADSEPWINLLVLLTNIIQTLQEERDLLLRVLGTTVAERNNLQQDIQDLIEIIQRQQTRLNPQLVRRRQNSHLADKHSQSKRPRQD